MLSVQFLHGLEGSTAYGTNIQLGTKVFFERGSDDVRRSTATKTTHNKQQFNYFLQEN